MRVLEVKNLFKYFGGVCANSNISLFIHHFVEFVMDNKLVPVDIP